MNDNVDPTRTPKTALIEILQKLEERIGRLEDNALVTQEAVSDAIAKHDGIVRGVVELREQFERLVRKLAGLDNSADEEKKGLLN